MFGCIYLIVDVKKQRRRPLNSNGWHATAPRASLIHFIFWIWVIGQAVLSRGILIVWWVEPSAQNSIYISNNTNHKKPAELNSYLLWPTQNLRALARNLRILMQRLWGLTGPIVLWVMWMVFIPYPFAPNGYLLYSFHSWRTKALSLSLSQAWCSQLPCSNLSDSLRDLALESVRKLENLLLRSCALGEALAAWFVCFSWSLSPRRLAVAR